jgi:hypothetical protein
MCAEASTILRAVAADFFFNCWYLDDIHGDVNSSSRTAVLYCRPITNTAGHTVVYLVEALCRNTKGRQFEF